MSRYGPLIGFQNHLICVDHNLALMPTGFHGLTPGLFCEIMDSVNIFNSNLKQVINYNYYFSSSSLLS